MLTTGFQSVAPLISRAASSLLILASSVCKSLQCLISALTQGGKDGHLFRLTCSVCCRVRGILQTVITGLCGECLQCMDHAGFAPAQFLAICVPCGSAGKESTCNMGDLGSIPGLGGSPGEGKGYPIEYSDLENSMDCIIHWVTKSRTRLSGFHFHFHGPCAFPVYTAQAPGCSEGELPKAGPGLHALPRSKLLRFRFSGTPQRQRLSWACVLCPSQVQGAQATRCFSSALSQVRGASYHLPGPSRSVSWVHRKSAISAVPCVSSWGLVSGCNPPDRCQPSRIPGRVG